MNGRVFKYPIGCDGMGTVVMPKGARLLSVGWQWETLAVWALIDGEAPKVERRCFVAFTGAVLPPEVDGFEFVGTAQLAIPSNRQMPFFVVHVFVEPEG